MQYDIIIPSRPNIHNLQTLLASISIQIQFPENIYIIIDKFCDKSDFENIRNILTYPQLNIHIITNYNTDFEPQKWVSYVRNYGIKSAQSPYIMLLDDDTELTPWFVSQIIDRYVYISNEQKHPFIIFPSIRYHNTTHIQTTWYNMMHYRMMRPEPALSQNDLKTKIRKVLFWRIDRYNIKSKHNTKLYNHIVMCPSICIFWPTQNFVQNLYDERMKFVYEDLDMTMRLSNHWIYIYNTPDIYIHHRESSRNRLQSSFLTPEMAYNKSRNRILFVNNNANRWEKVLFFTIWLPWQTLWFIIFVLIFWQQKSYTIWQIFKWIYDWIRGK